MEDKNIIIFDGICNFCNDSVNFIIRHDPKKKFMFVPMQSKEAIRLIEKYQVQYVGSDTILLIKNEQPYIRTDAALEITKDLSGYWYLFNLMKILPRSFRDFFYNLFARNRYYLFGKRDACMIPSNDVRSRFIK